MKTGKSIAIFLVVLLGLVAAGVFFLVGNLDGLVKKAIEQYGTAAAGTPVRVTAVEIDLRSATGSIAGLSLANPPGFSSRPLFELGRITLTLDASSLAGDTPTIENLHVTAPRLLFEVNPQGQTNLRPLQRNLNADPPATGHTDGAKPAEEVRLRVRRLTISEATGIFDLTAIGGKRLTETLPPLTLTDIGGRQGVPPEELGRIVLTALSRELERAAARHGVEDIVKSRLESAAGKLQQKLEEELGKGTGRALRQLLDD